MIPEFLSKAFGDHWHTSLTALVSGFFAFVIFAPEYFPPIIIDLGKFASIGGLASLGVRIVGLRKPK